MIAQADSRKWMACLYNSFLFMEAKIMKMAKKLLALVLTGVMAVSMLTGCALSDKVAEKELLESLKVAGQGETPTVVYEKGESVTKAGTTTKIDLKKIAKAAATAAAKKTGADATAIATGLTFTDSDKVVVAIVAKPTNDTERTKAANTANGTLKSAYAVETKTGATVTKKTIKVYADSFSAKESTAENAKSHDYIVIVAVKA